MSMPIVAGPNCTGEHVKLPKRMFGSALSKVRQATHGLFRPCSLPPSRARLTKIHSLDSIDASDSQALPCSIVPRAEGNLDSSDGSAQYHLSDALHILQELLENNDQKNALLFTKFLAGPSFSAVTFSCTPSEFWGKLSAYYIFETADHEEAAPKDQSTVVDALNSLATSSGSQKRARILNYAKICQDLEDHDHSEGSDRQPSYASENSTSRRKASLQSLSEGFDRQLTYQSENSTSTRRLSSQSPSKVSPSSKGSAPISSGQTKRRVDLADETLKKFQDERFEVIRKRLYVRPTRPSCWGL